MSGPNDCGDPIWGIFDKDQIDQSYNLTNLRPYIRYKVQVIGINEGGASESSEDTARAAESSRFQSSNNGGSSSSSVSSCCCLFYFSDMFHLIQYINIHENIGTQPS